MELQLNGKTAIVTGASRGIGRAIATGLAAEGANVVLAARTRADLESLAATLPTTSLVQPLDLREPDAPARLVAAALERFGGIDVLVNNAGATKRGEFLELTDEDWADGFALKFFGAMRCCRSAWPHLAKRGGAIVNIAGIGGRVGSRDFTIGGTVNAALMNLTKGLADLGRAEGVRINTVNPGFVDTDRLRGRIEAYARDHGVAPEEASAALARELGVERFGEPEEIARLVAYLASPAAAFCHGAIIDIDGGRTLAV